MKIKFEDSFAQNISWSPLKGGGASFKTSKFIEKDPGHFEIAPSFGGLLFSSIFVVIGVGSIGFSWFDFFFGKGQIEGVVFGTLFGGIFAFVGSFFLKDILKTTIINKFEGKITTRNGLIVRFDEIYALQLISEYIQGNKSSYYSYELNLVLKNRKRINLFDQGDLEASREDAIKLSKLLHVPFWDSTQEKFKKSA